MKFGESNDFDSRRRAASEARLAMVSRFGARPGPDDPDVLSRQAQRRAVLAAREARVGERALHRLAEEERLAQVAAAERAAEVVRKAAEAEVVAERARSAQAARKEERDARYAARKAKIKLRR